MVAQLSRHGAPLTIDLPDGTHHGHGPRNRPDRRRAGLGPLTRQTRPAGSPHVGARRPQLAVADDHQRRTARYLRTDRRSPRGR